MSGLRALSTALPMGIVRVTPEVIWEDGCRLRKSEAKSAASGARSEVEELITEVITTKTYALST